MKYSKRTDDYVENICTTNEELIRKRNHCSSFKRTVAILIENNLLKRTQAILRMNACHLTFAISWFVLLSQALFVPCLFKKAMVKLLTFVFRIARTYSSLERSVGHFQVNFKISRFLICSKNSQILIIDSFNLGKDILHPQSKFRTNIPGGSRETKSKTATRNTPNIS